MPFADESSARNWRWLYEQAMLEDDHSQIHRRIADAENAMIQRSRELAKLGQFDGEDTELTAAILSLCDLKRKTGRYTMG